MYCVSQVYFVCFQEDYAAQGLQAMKEDMLDRQFKLNVEYRVGGQVKIFSIHGGFEICPGECPDFGWI